MLMNDACLFPSLLLWLLLLLNIRRWDWFASTFTPSAALYSTLSTILATASEISQVQALMTGTMV